MSWRAQIKIHPAADLFPMMSDAELDALAADIKKNGLLHRVIVWTQPDKKNLQLLDGRNRLAALERLGLQFNIDEHAHYCFTVDTDDPYSYVIGANILRRHLSSEQKRDLIVKLLKLDAGKSDRQIAETVKASPTTVGTVRKKLEATGDVSNLDTRTDTKGRKQPARKAKTSKPKPKSMAEAFGVQDVEASAELRKAEAATDEVTVPGDENSLDEDHKGFVLAVIRNSSEKVDIATRNVSPNFTVDDRADITQAVDALIRKWESFKRKLRAKKATTPTAAEEARS